VKNFSTIITTLFLCIPAFSTDFITLGTGEINGTYYPTGHYLCKFVNKNRDKTNVRCSVESTDGSVYNINAIQSGKFNFAIAQSDTVYQAINGIQKFKNKPVKKLRAVMSIYPELFTLITRKDSSISNVAALKGKRVNMGNIKSGSEAIALELLNEYGLKRGDFVSSSLKIADTEDALIDNKIDAYFFMVGHPAETIKNAADSIDISIVPILENEVKEFIAKRPYFVPAIIPAKMYKGVNESIPTFSVKAVIVTSEETSEKIIYTFVKSILENFEEFKKLHPAYKNITKESLLEGLGAPLHEGARKYFKEVGLL